MKVPKSARKEIKKSALSAKKDYSENKMAKLFDADKKDKKKIFKEKTKSHRSHVKKGGNLAKFSGDKIRQKLAKNK